MLTSLPMLPFTQLKIVFISSAKIFLRVKKLKLQFLVKKNWDWTHDLSVTRQPSCLLFHHKGLRGNGMFCKQERSFVAYLFCKWQTSVKFFYYSRPIEHRSTVALRHCDTEVWHFQWNLLQVLNKASKDLFLNWLHFFTSHPSFNDAPKISKLSKTTLKPKNNSSAEEK